MAGVGSLPGARRDEMVLVQVGCSTARADISGVDHDLPAHLVRGVITGGLCVLLEFFSGLNDNAAATAATKISAMKTIMAPIPMAAILSSFMSRCVLVFK